MFKFDYSRLRGNIKAVFNRQTDFAKAMGMSAASLTAKLNNQTEFTQREILKAAKLLKLNEGEIITNFFTLEVQKY